MLIILPWDSMGFTENMSLLLLCRSELSVLTLAISSIILKKKKNSEQYV